MSTPTWSEMTAEEVQQWIKEKGSGQVIDVREPEEWVSGHIEGARHIPLQQLPYRLQELDPQVEYILVCRSGVRSAMACEFLSAHGYRVYNMTGGMLAWPGEIATG